MGALAGLLVGGGVATAVVMWNKSDSKPAQAAAQKSAFLHSPKEEGVIPGGAPATPSGFACERVDLPPPEHVRFGAPEQVVEPGERLTAVVETSCGSFDIALDTTRAPRTVNSFVFLSEKGFYDDLTFHRIAPGFVIQGGDPLGDGTGGPGYSVDEKPPTDLAYTKGVVAMAKSSGEPPGRSGSQFFVVLGTDAGLPPEYALVGKVSRGLDVVEGIGELGTPTEEPKQTILIDHISIDRG